MIGEGPLVYRERFVHMVIGNGLDHLRGITRLLHEEPRASVDQLHGVGLWPGDEPYVSATPPTKSRS